MLLSSDDLYQLTDTNRKDKQINWLMNQGIRFVLSAVGKPKVLHAEIERVMLGGSKKPCNIPRFDKVNG